MVDNGKKKGLRTPPLKWVSAQLLYIESAHDGNHNSVVSAWRQSQCGRNLCGHIVSVHDGNHHMDRIFVGLSWELQCWQQSDCVLKRWWTTAREKGSEPYHQSELLCNYYTLSADTNTESVVRIFIGLSCKLWFHYLFNCILHYAAQFSPTRSVTISCP